MNVSIDNLDREIQKIAEEYVEDVRDAVEEIVPKVGKDAVKELKKTSPTLTGKYAKGWKSKVERGRLGSSVVIYNKVYYLTHLLEKGHALKNGGRVPAYPHIRPAEENAVKNMLKLLKEKL